MPNTKPCNELGKAHKWRERDERYSNYSSQSVGKYWICIRVRSAVGGEADDSVRGPAVTPSRSSRRARSLSRLRVSPLKRRAAPGRTASRSDCRSAPPSEGDGPCRGTTRLARGRRSRSERTAAKLSRSGCCCRVIRCHRESPFYSSFLLRVSAQVRFVCFGTRTFLSLCCLCVWPSVLFALATARTMFTA